MRANLKTYLSTCDPTARYCMYSPMRRGATYIYDYEIGSSVLEMLDQVTFMLKQGDTLCYYDLYADSKEGSPKVLDSHFQVKDGVVHFYLSPDETAIFEVTEMHDLDSIVKFQVALNYKEEILRSGSAVPDIVTIEDQPGIIVLDSLYYDILPYRGPGICSENTYASDKTICKD